MGRKLGIVTLSLSFLLTGCHTFNDFFHQKIKKPVVKPIRSKRITQNRKLSAFTALEVDGVIDVAIKPKLGRSSVVLTGDARDLEKVFTSVDKRVLNIEVHTNFPRYGKLHATVYSPKLTSLSYKGEGDVNYLRAHRALRQVTVASKGRFKLGGSARLSKFTVSGETKADLTNIRSKRLELFMNGAPKVNFRGKMNLEFLKYGGSGRLSMYWLNSPDLRVEGFGKAKVYLAGHVHYLHAYTHGKSELDGRYLRVDKAFVKARDFSLVRLQPIKQLNALASGHGHIYYYNSPEFRADHMTENGGVLNYVRYR